MSTTLIATVSAISALLAMTLRRSPPKRATGARSPVKPTTAVRNPQALKTGLWQVRPCHPGCEHTRLLVGRVLTAADTVPLPQQDPDRPGCSCYYIPVHNQRRRERRYSDERRGSFRMSANDRRARIERRHAHCWAGMQR